MGVKKLQNFFEKRYTNWRHENVVGNVVIDGSALCYHLYCSEESDLDWAEGGQYPKYMTIIVDFFRKLRRAKIQPTVVFDGIDSKDEKFKTKRDRHEKRACQTYMLCKQQSGESPESNATNQPTDGMNILPQLAYEVFQETLREMGIPVHLADGEGDIAIAQLAHYLKCPIISKDSDFYMFHLPRGYIPLNQLPKIFEAEQKVEIYYDSDFLEHFQFQNDSLRFLIPAVMGNDFIEPLRDLQSSICQQFTSSKLKDEDRLYLLVMYISQCDSLDAFLFSIPQTTPSDVAALRENYDRAEAMYSVPPPQDSSELDAGREDIPQWLLDQFRCGRLAPFLLEARLLGHQFMSYSLTSRPLHQHMYSMLGVPSVTEYPIIDGKFKVKPKSVYASVCIPQNLLLPLSEIHDCTLAKRNQLYYTIVGCHSDQREIEKLPDRWRLAITSVIYWARECQPKPEKHLIKALVLCILLHCNQKKHFPKIRSEVSELCASKLEYGDPIIKARKAFVEWQFTYLDTMALNQLLMEPLEFVSPAELYDGQIAMHLACDRKHYREVQKKISKYDKGLFTRLLSIIFSQSGQNAAELDESAPVPSTASPGDVEEK